MLVKAARHRPEFITCTVNDRFVLRVPVSVVFLYRKKIPLEPIVESLRDILSDFPLFAGRIALRNHRLFIDCDNSGVCVETEESSGRLTDGFPGTHLTNPIDVKKGPVLRIKLNYRSDGTAIGFTWHHSIGDMACFMKFLRSLSAKAQNLPYTLPEILHDRNEAVKPKENSCLHLKYLTPLDFIYLAKEALTPKKTGYFYFSPREIEVLRNSLRHSTGSDISRNTALCAHLIETLLEAGCDRKSASIVLNFRSRLGMNPDLLGNFVDTVRIGFDGSRSAEAIAETIRDAVKNYRHGYPNTEEYIRKAGGIEKIGRIMPKEILPQEKNLLITSWANFGVYSVDFGIEAPFLFLPAGKSPLPWVSAIVEGFDNQGLLLSLMLPSGIMNRIRHPDRRAQLHRFRPKDDIVPSEYRDFPFL